jgi:hypothetical protein
MMLKKYQHRARKNRDSEYEAEAAKGLVFQYNTAVTLRLTESVHNSGRTVIGDSAFSSVSTAKACRQFGMHFMGIIKTATKQFPKAVLQAWAGLNVTRGSFTAMSTTSEPRLYALAWADKKTKLLISTLGSTAMADPAIRNRARLRSDGKTERYVIKIPRPQLVKDFYACFNAVDTNDQFRQGILKLEDHWRTHSWVTRAITTIFGVILTNAHLLCKGVRRALGENSRSKFLKDMDKLAHRLIFNPWLPTIQRELPPSSLLAFEGDAEIERKLRQKHILAVLNSTTKYREVSSPRLRCVECHKHTRWYCMLCSDDSRGHYVAVCRVQKPQADNPGLCQYIHEIRNE